jgi:hypothetical protein
LSDISMRSIRNILCPNSHPGQVASQEPEYLIPVAKLRLTDLESRT